MSSFTPDELRGAIVALDTIERDGDSNELAYILREVRNATPSADPWGNAGIGAQLNADHLAGRLATMLDVPRVQCEQAARAVFSKDYCRAVFDALISYANELTGQTSRRTSSAAPSMPTHRPTIRIVADREGAA